MFARRSPILQLALFLSAISSERRIDSLTYHRCLMLFAEGPRRNVGLLLVTYPGRVSITPRLLPSSRIYISPTNFVILPQQFLHALTIRSFSQSASPIGRSTKLAIDSVVIVLVLVSLFVLFIVVAVRSTPLLTFHLTCP